MKYELRWIMPNGSRGILCDSPFQSEEDVIEALKMCEEVWPDYYYAVIPVCEIPIYCI